MIAHDLRYDDPLALPDLHDLELTESCMCPDRSRPRGRWLSKTTAVASDAFDGTVSETLPKPAMPMTVF